jgi:hypothetical protein
MKKLFIALALLLLFATTLGNYAAYYGRPYYGYGYPYMGSLRYYGWPYSWTYGSYAYPYAYPYSSYGWGTYGWPYSLRTYRYWW